MDQSVKNLELKFYKSRNYKTIFGKHISVEDMDQKANETLYRYRRDFTPSFGRTLPRWARLASSAGFLVGACDSAWVHRK